MRNREASFSQTLRSPLALHNENWNITQLYRWLNKGSRNEASFDLQVWQGKLILVSGSRVLNCFPVGRGFCLLKFYFPSLQLRTTPQQS